jgi:hypothetical protein
MIMKKLNIFLIFLFTSSFLFSCKNGVFDRGPLFGDKTKPTPVTNIKVTNIAGGAIITYDVHADPSILYVQADYSVNDKVSRQAKSSYYSDTITVSGFAKAGVYKVILHSISRSEIKSDPVEVTVNPLTPNYLTVGATLKLFADFGGVNVSYLNPSESELGVVVIVDSLDGFEYLDTKYMKEPEGNFSVRGLPTKERTFGAYVRDRWGNVSDTVYSKLSPLREVELDRAKISGLYLPGDMTGCCGSSLSVPLSNNGASDWALYGITLPDTKTPSRITYDLGGTVKMSRFRLWFRVNGIAEFANGTPKTFKLYGSNNPNPDGSLDATWTQLGGRYELKKPSGLPYGKRNAEDDAAKQEGFEFTLPLPAQPIRYWRFVMVSNYSQSLGMEISCLKFWGDPQ